MFDLNGLRAHCAAKIGAYEDYPFDTSTLTYKVQGKIFAFIPMNIGPDDAPRISLKCDPTLAELLRNTYDAVQPGYHLNKKHWNTVTVDGTIAQDEILEMIDNSYDLVVSTLSKTSRDQLKKG